MREILTEFDILPTTNDSAPKSISEQIIVKIFGGTVKN